MAAEGCNSNPPENGLRVQQYDGSPCPIVGPHTCDRAEHIDGSIAPGEC